MPELGCLQGNAQTLSLAPAADHSTLDGGKGMTRVTLGKSRMRGAIGEADMSVPVQVWSAQSRAGRAGASLAGVAATPGPKRRQRSYGV